MIRSRLTLLLLICARALLSQADTVSLRPSADTTLFQFNPNFNLGGVDSFMVGTIAKGAPARGLIKFNLGAKIPTSAVITSVTLTVTVVGTPSAAVNSTVQVHRVLQDWGEGVKGNSFIRTGEPATANEATWNARFFGSKSWSQPGASAPGDFSATISVSQSILGNASYTFHSTSNLLADVQGWLQTPATNFGWILISDRESQLRSVRRYASRENSFSAPPVLAIGFSVPSPPAPPRIDLAERRADIFRLGFAAEANRAYQVQYRDSLAAGLWLTLTNLAAPSSAQELIISDAIGQNLGRFYRIQITP